MLLIFVSLFFFGVSKGAQRLLDQVVWNDDFACDSSSINGDNGWTNCRQDVMGFHGLFAEKKSTSNTTTTTAPMAHIKFPFPTFTKRTFLTGGEGVCTLKFRKYCLCAVNQDPDLLFNFLPDTLTISFEGINGGSLILLSTINCAFLHTAYEDADKAPQNAKAIDPAVRLNGNICNNFFNESIMPNAVPKLATQLMPNTTLCRSSCLTTKSLSSFSDESVDFNVTANQEFSLSFVWSLSEGGEYSAFNNVKINCSYGLTPSPSSNPSKITRNPTIPTVVPTNFPTTITRNPTLKPSPFPSLPPTEGTPLPTRDPTPPTYPGPTIEPTRKPTRIPSVNPTNSPSAAPSILPRPTSSPSVQITDSSRADNRNRFWISIFISLFLINVF